MPRDWYFPTARVRLCRRIASVVISGVAIGIIIGGLMAGDISVDDLPLLVRDESAVIRPQVGFPSCDAARAAGAAPLYRGQPGYNLHLDNDGDGIACEPLPLRSFTTSVLPNGQKPKLRQRWGKSKAQRELRPR